jgi:hypothetical protein
MADIPEELAPSGEDERALDSEYNVAVDPSKAKPWLNLLRESEEAFEDWNTCCDNLEKEYANLQYLRRWDRQKQFSLFWANLEILKPAIYAKPPVPVVVPKFKDRRPLYQMASDVMERACTVAFDVARVNDLLLLVRDDVCTIGRGVLWCRYEPAEGKKPRYNGNGGGYGNGYSDYRPEYVCLDHKDRRDFLHSLSRNWREVSWVAAASYLTRPQARERFREYSGDEYQRAEYKVDKDAKEIGGGDNRERAKFWEIWHKGLQRVVWVAEGCEDVLDEGEPHLQLQGFFPCPKPAYSTTQPGSLVPVPDLLQYKDQLDEVNTLTGRIHALSDALEVKGFYPAGSTEIADAVEKAVAIKTPGKVMVPISNWAAFGGSKEVIIWLPIDMVANCITAVVALRKQVIDDIYQIMGLSDIMRGATDPQETLGAQQLKSQYGSARIRDKQAEMVRIARDTVEITAEIICGEFSPQTIIAMCQMEIPTDAMQMQKVQGMQQQLLQQQAQFQKTMQRAQSDPRIAQMAQQNPKQAQQLIQQAQGQLQNLQQDIQDEMQRPTLERVMRFLKDYRTTSFVLDIETDSTIQADEQAEKQRRGEFMGMLSALLPQLGQLIAAKPQTAAFCGEILKFAVAPFRVGRPLDSSIDELVELLESAGSQGDSKQNAEQQKLQQQAQIEQQKLEHDKAKAAQDAQIKMTEMQNKHQVELQKMQNDYNLALLEMQGQREENQAHVQEVGAKMTLAREAHDQKMRESAVKASLGVQAQQQRQVDAQSRQDEMAHRRALADRSQIFKERQAAMKPIGGAPGGRA